MIGENRAPHTYLTKNPLPYFFQKSFSTSFTDIFVLAMIDIQAVTSNFVSQRFRLAKKIDASIPN